MLFLVPLRSCRNSRIENQGLEYSESMILELGESIIVRSCDWLRFDRSIETMTIRTCLVDFVGLIGTFRSEIGGCGPCALSTQASCTQPTVVGQEALDFLRVGGYPGTLNGECCRAFEGPVCAHKSCCNRMCDVLPACGLGAIVLGWTTHP
ncbi:unnamed protein product [Prunus armeniaca]